MTEHWLPVKDYEGHYMVSTNGEVKSLARCYKGGLGALICLPERIMAPQKHYKGYRFITLKREGTRRKEFIHRLVALHFLDNPLSKPYVNHLDRDKTNNALTNLEWATEQENSDHWVQDDALRAAVVATVSDEDLPW